MFLFYLVVMRFNLPELLQAYEEAFEDISAFIERNRFLREFYRFLFGG